jgi:hypothetical protein
MLMEFVILCTECSCSICKTLDNEGRKMFGETEWLSMRFKAANKK